jgi:hypothetical protein
MTLTAGPILEAARDRHVSFDRRHHPDPSCLRYLSGYVRTLHGTVAVIDETALAVEEIIALPLFDFSLGAAVPANRTIVGAVLKDARGIVYDFDLVQWGNRHDRNRARLVAWEVGGRLYLSGAATDYTSYSEIGLLLVPIPVDLTSLTSAIGLPDSAQQCLETKVALFMALRGHDDEAMPKPDARALASEASEAETRFLADIGNRVAGRRFPVRDVFPR